LIGGKGKNFQFFYFQLRNGVKKVPISMDKKVESLTESGGNRFKLPNSKSQKGGESIREEKKKYTSKRRTGEETMLIFKL